MVHGELEIGTGSEAPHAQCDALPSPTKRQRRRHQWRWVERRTAQWTGGIMLMGGTLNLPR